MLWNLYHLTKAIKARSAKVQTTDSDSRHRIYRCYLDKTKVFRLFHAYNKDDGDVDRELWFLYDGGLLSLGKRVKCLNINLTVSYMSRIIFWHHRHKHCHRINNFATVKVPQVALYRVQLMAKVTYIVLSSLCLQNKDQSLLLSGADCTPRYERFRSFRSTLIFSCA